MLGLPARVRACVFDVDGVLADSGAVHALAWAEVLDPLLLRLSEEAGWEFVPFDRVADYREYVDGRSRDEGVRAFLASRGIHLRDDAVAALARGKGEALTRARHRRRVGALPGARRYLEAAGRAGLPRAVVSTSTSTRATLELVGLTPVIDEVVDGEVARADALRPRPAPDLLLAACRRVGVDPAAAVTLTRTPAGVAAGHAAGLHVIGVGAGKRAELLGGFGAGQVVPSLGALLDRRLAS
jgi:HAD superfamily hydrolase (TIGR01509 family)